MGIGLSKCYAEHESVNELQARIQLLEEEIREMSLLRDGEARAYERHVVHSACREEEWRLERKKHKDEAARLRQRLEEEEERVRALEESAAAAAAAAAVAAASGGNAGVGGCVVEGIVTAEQAAAERWKQLYHAIKTELDDLIHRTRQGERYCCGVEQGMLEGVELEVRAKEEMLEALRLRLASMEKDAIRKEREIDILRQSLRILGSSKRNLPKSLRLKNDMKLIPS